MILEGIVTTLQPDGTTNVAPMGPRVDDSTAPAIERFLLRPFPTSSTCGNLLRTRRGVLHVTDDVELLARAAVDRLDSPPPLTSLEGFGPLVLQNACRWYAFEVAEIDQSEERVKLDCRVVRHGWHRDFFGFNRAKHAVLEAAILATRVAILPPEQIRDELRRLSVIVEKTAGTAERRAFEFLHSYVDEVLR